MENMKVNPMDFVSFILKLNEDVQMTLNIPEDIREGITNLKMQKLIYFIEGMFMSKFNKRFFGLNYEAWIYGPVLFQLYLALKSNGRNQIFFDKEQKKNFNSVKKKFNKSELEYIINVFININKFSASELVTLSHVEGPWKDTPSGSEIDPYEIKKYFEEKFKDYFSYEN